MFVLSCANSDHWFLYLSYRRERKSKYVHCPLLCTADLRANYLSRKLAARNLDWFYRFSKYVVRSKYVGVLLSNLTFVITHHCRRVFVKVSKWIRSLTTPQFRNRNTLSVQKNGMKFFFVNDCKVHLKMSNLVTYVLYNHVFLVILSYGRL